MKLSRILQLTAILAVSIALVIFLRTPKHFPLKTVTVNATYEHISQDELRKIITPYLQDASFFHINLAAIKTKIMQFPWVYQINSHRVWPDKIVITITEQQPVAIWNGNSLFNQDGVIFTPTKNSLPTDIPTVNGPSDQEEQVWDFFTDMNEKLQPFNLQINALNFDPAIGWQVVLSDGIAIQFGDDDLQTKLQQFFKSIPKVIKPREADIQSIDFRYANGFAVKYKDTPTPTTDATAQTITH
jgi:cell division protein FtsQ